MRQKLSLLTKTMLLLGALVAGSGSAWAQVTLWNEDFSDYSANDVPKGGTYSYVCTNGSGGTTKIYDEKTAGGEKPELLVSKKSGTFSATVPLNNIEGDLTLSYKQNAQSLTVSTTTTGVSVKGTATYSSSGTHTVTLTGVTTAMTSVVIKFTGPSGNSNVRLDDIVLTGNKASSIEAPKINLESGFYATAQSVTITTNEDGGTTYYTTDGTAPSNESTPYTGAISITSTTTLKAITYKGEEKSGVVQETYTIAEDGVFDFVAAGAAGYDYGSGMSFSEDYTTTNKTWISGNVTMVSSGKYRWWAADKTLRFYSNTPASAATFSVPEGYVITKIATTGGNFITASEGTLSGSTWTGASQSVKLSISNSTVNFKTISVTYTNEFTKAVESYGWATYVAPTAVSFAAGDAYVVTAASVSGGLTVKGVTSVPTGTPVLLQGEGTKNITVVASASAPETNLLSVCDGTIAAGKYAYVLAKDGAGAAFMQWTGEASVLNGRAVLLLDEAIATARQIFVRGLNEADGISDISRENMNNNHEVYDLQGRRVAQPTKGLFIVNGKKMMVK